MEFTNSKGVKWYLNKVKRIIGRNKQEVDTYFFSKVKPAENASLPLKYTIKETKSGLPIIKKL